MLRVLPTSFQKLSAAIEQITRCAWQRKRLVSWLVVALAVGLVMTSLAEALHFLGCDWEVVGNCIVGHCHWPIIGDFDLFICIG